MGYRQIRVCDFCGEDNDAIRECDLCGLDFCSMCGREMIFLKFCLCKNCIEKAQKLRSEILKTIKSGARD